MSKARIAHNPDLSFLMVHPEHSYDHPYLLDSGGRFDWDANTYLVEYGGGRLCYGAKPQPSDIVKEARSLAIFLTFIEDVLKINKLNLCDDHLFTYVKHIKKRNVDNGTIKTHCRTAIDYIFYLQAKNKHVNLITDKANEQENYQIHVTKKFYSGGGKVTPYFDHKSFEHLVKVKEDIDYIRDDEFIDWLDAINHTTEHPSPDKLLKLRWQAISYLLDATGSRISELAKITRSSIKDIYNPFADGNDTSELKCIPINKGKNKGKFRKIHMSNGTIQLLMEYIKTIEREWPNMEHDNLFVNVDDGQPLKPSYIKNYTLSVIKNSIYGNSLKNVNNHSFRHRFITLNVAQKIKELSPSSPFPNLYSLAMHAVRKLTLHASASSMETYVHLAQEYNNKYRLKNEHAQVNSIVKTELKKLKRLQKQLESGQINESFALERMVSIIKEI
ncbi:site-specific integrase [Pseudoalteromonas sp. Ps84H-4]|uniref:site-specific integrase n=1 Tax=Pseudoalteromonas sp. Ps84H-4 TaxID=2954502 RepID=UPI0020972A2C|nr:site-specific integrase [Pseudoalteromonas sp. Ps84H-4]MCO7251442.1 site-specific integrase [Pseudoalteromonas sp. Ps84H-4]